MLKIIFCEEGIPVSDFEAKNKAEKDILNYLNKINRLDITEEIKVSNECYLESFVLYAMKGLIPEDEIEFYCREDKYGYTNIQGLIYPEGKEPVNIWIDLIQETIKVGYRNLEARRAAGEKNNEM